MRLPTIRLLTLGIGALASLSVAGPVSAQETNRKADYPPKMEGSQEHVYRQLDGEPLKLWAFSPKEHRAGDARPAILFFFGGGWTGGTPKQFEQQCRYLASRGMVAMTADYRVASRQKVKAIDCVDDAFHAMRWVRDHAKELGIHPTRLPSVEVLPVGTWLLASPRLMIPSRNRMTAKQRPIPMPWSSSILHWRWPSFLAFACRIQTKWNR